ncbi:MAG: hypothetical protein QXD04_06990 [Candidatus Bathyarchaeia archaeon]
MTAKASCVLCGASLHRPHRTVPAVYPAGTMEEAPVCCYHARRVAVLLVEVRRNPHLRFVYVLAVYKAKSRHSARRGEDAEEAEVLEGGCEE